MNWAGRERKWSWSNFRYNTNASTATERNRVELGYNVMKGTEYFVSV
jgi:hypothetical protein